MGQRDLYNNISPAISIAPAAYTATTNGAGVDCAGFEGAMVEIISGVVTDGTYTFEVQESTDDSTYTAVSGTDLSGSEPVYGTTDDSTVSRVGYKGGLQYLRVTVNVTGATTGAVLSASVLRGHERHHPV